MLFRSRTGRAGSEGEAISLVCVDEHKLLRDIERMIKREIDVHVYPGYEPDPSIRAEPIQMRSAGARGPGGGRGAPRGKPGGAPSGNRSGAPKPGGAAKTGGNPGGGNHRSGSRHR